MASVTRRLAFYDLRDWWLSFADVQRLLSSDGSPVGLEVFVPAAQQPETGYPYVRYNVRKTTDFPRRWVHNEFVVMELYAVDIEDSTELTNFLVSLTDRDTDSAQELQRWVRSQTGRPQDFQYHWLEFAGGGEILPPDEEGAAHGRSLSFAINYSPLSGFGIR